MLNQNVFIDKDSIYSKVLKCTIIQVYFDSELIIYFAS